MKGAYSFHLSKYQKEPLSQRAWQELGKFVPFRYLCCPLICGSSNLARVESIPPKPKVEFEKRVRNRTDKNILKPKPLRLPYKWRSQIPTNGKVGTFLYITLKQRMILHFYRISVQNAEGSRTHSLYSCTPFSVRCITR